MSTNAEFHRTLRRLTISERTATLPYRKHAQLPFFSKNSPGQNLLLDTTVYIDELQNELPFDLELMLGVSGAWHSPVTECELAALAGLLHPEHPSTPRAIEQLIAMIEERPAYRIVNVDREVWRSAGILAGMLTRLQQYGKSEHRKALNDALLFLSAMKHGLTVLTRNVREFDLLLQLEPKGRCSFMRSEDL